MPPTSPGAAPGGRARVAPVPVIVGDEELVVERAVRGMATEVAAALSPREPDGAGGGAGETGAGLERAGAAGTAGGASLDVHDVRAADLKPGDLSALTAPSLFGGGGLVIVRSVQDATKDVAAELGRYAAAPAPDMVLVITHSGGARNKSLLASLASDGAGRVDCPASRP